MCIRDRSDIVRPILQGLHDRVMGLATVHMGLYQTSGQKDVQMDELVAGVIRQITALGNQQRHKPLIETQLEPLRLIPDQAVPLSLLLAELLTGVSIQTGPGAGPGVVTLIEKEEGQAQVRITGAPVAGLQPTSEPTPTVIGTQLVRGFAQQIGGRLQVSSTAGKIDVALEFPIRRGNET